MDFGVGGMGVGFLLRVQALESLSKREIDR